MVDIEATMTSLVTLNHLETIFPILDLGEARKSPVTCMTGRGKCPLLQKIPSLPHLSDIYRLVDHCVLHLFTTDASSEHNDPGVGADHNNVADNTFKDDFTDLQYIPNLGLKPKNVPVANPK
mgnify:CR=1 FL=1